MVSETNLRHGRRNLIVGGDLVRPGQYPYYVSINGECGGSLIAPDIVLTAGHCKPMRTIARNYTHDLDYVRVGIVARNPELYDDDLVLAEETFTVLEAKRHSRFKRYGDDEFKYDYSLIRLNGTAFHPTLSLNRDEVLLNNIDQVTVMGLGDTHPDRPSRSNWLREVNLTVVPNDECEQTRGRGISYEGRIGKSHLCTFAHHKDSCAWDSGSPIIIRHDGKHLLVGMVSWGIECADSIFPAVNSRVSVALDWIDETVCAWSANPPAEFGCEPTISIGSFGTWSPPFMANVDFVFLVILCAMAAVGSRLLWRPRREDYEQLK